MIGVDSGNMYIAWHVPFWTGRRGVILNQALIDDSEEPGQGLYIYQKVTVVNVPYHAATKQVKSYMHKL